MIVTSYKETSPDTQEDASNGIKIPNNFLTYERLKNVWEMPNRIE